jgi:subtilisin family serine protease
VRPGAPVRATLNAIRAYLGPVLEGLQVYNPPGHRFAVLMFAPLPDAVTRIPLLATQLAARPDLRYAEPDFVGSGHSTPNDPRYKEQWWPQKIGIEKLWRLTTGDPRVLLAVADSGISIPEGTTEPDHEDLRGPRFIVAHNNGEQPVTHDYTGDDLTAVRPPRDKYPHGTHVTGIAAATANNSRGVAGANWKSPVFVVRVLDDQNDPSVSAVVSAVYEICRYWVQGWLDDLWRWRKRVVINLSLGVYRHSDALREMCEYTHRRGVMLCVAAGPRPYRPHDIDFPAAFAADFYSVIAVGATNEDDRIVAPNRDSYGAITIFAPGMNILSCVPTYPCPHTTSTDGYGSDSGSSQACAIVSGVVSLLWSGNRALTTAQIRNALVGHALPVATHSSGNYPRLNLL